MKKIEGGDNSQFSPQAIERRKIIQQVSEGHDSFAYRFSRDYAILFDLITNFLGKNLNEMHRQAIYTIALIGIKNLAHAHLLVGDGHKLSNREKNDIYADFLVT